jgi:hypothetical protein
MVLNSNGTFIETNYYVTTPTGQASQNTNFVRTGTWTLSGTNLTLSIPAQNGRLALYDSGTLDLNTINYQEDGGSGVGLQQYEYKR